MSHDENQCIGHEIWPLSKDQRRWHGNRETRYCRSGTTVLRASQNRLLEVRQRVVRDFSLCAPFVLFTLQF